MQLRYRWEIAPLSDIFLVYTRLADGRGKLKGFSDILSESYRNPLEDRLVLKFRYPLGS